MGLPVLLGVLSEDRDDMELMRGALEALLLSISTQGAPNTADGPSKVEVCMPCVHMHM